MGFWGFVIIPPGENFHGNRGNGSKNHLKKFRIRKFWKILCEVEGWVYRCCNVEPKWLLLVNQYYHLMKHIFTLILGVFFYTQVHSQSVNNHIMKISRILLFFFLIFLIRIPDLSAQSNYTLSQISTDYCLNVLRFDANNYFLMTNATVKIASSPNGPYRDWETDRKSTRLNSSH